MATQYANGKIVTDDLVLALNAADKNSYPGSGTTWYDTSGNGNNFTLTNSPTFGNHRGTPCFSLSGVDDYITRAGSISYDIGSACTLFIIMASFNNSNFGHCSRLFSVNDGSSNNVDYTSFFTLASCDQTRYGLWYKNSPGGLYPTSVLKTATDEYKVLTYKWTAGNTAYIFVNGIQESSSAITTAFNYTSVNRMTIGMNSSLNIENATVRVAGVYMYNRELSSTEILQNYNAQKSRFSL